jgi:Holliday junction resolvase RusA-like endonuclease
MVKFTVLGEPKGKGRPRMTARGRTYTPKDTVQYENLVRIEYRRQCGDFKFQDGTPLDARITAYFSIPQSVSKKKRQMMMEHKVRPTKKPDVDNVAKVVLDSINGVAYHDDAQVVDCQVRKFYSDNPRIVVTLQESQSF